MARWLVIADDLTGAADCAVAWAGHGLRSMVVLGTAGCVDGDAEVAAAEVAAAEVAAAEVAAAEVLAVDANTRLMGSGQAAAETARLMRAGALGETALVYKKIDSTLRGNVAVELAAALDARRATAADGERIVVVLAPAFPANGRTTVNGLQLVRGRRLEETGLWQFEATPARSSIAELLGEARLRTALVELETVRSGDEALQSAMTRTAQEADVLVCDAETDTDLYAIACASMSLGPGTIWAGSAGLAYQLPRAVEGARERAQWARSRLAEGPALFVAGSGSSISREQVRVLESWSNAFVARIAPAALLAREASAEWGAHRSALERALSAGREAVVMPEAEPVLEGQGPRLAAALAELVRPLAERVGALVATGGETARAVFEAWGIGALRIMGEVEPGLPYSVAAGWRRALPVLTKAGGFGRAETFLHCRQFLHGLNRGGA